jgi:hypothetical protein|tara:strand:- start:3135 stop:3632 length:498 start_codon:yes stop_codon:yes gene_type:complete
MKSVNIKGKEYITVNERLIYFRSKPAFKGWKIIEEIISLDEKEGVFKVTILNSENHQIVNAHAQEYRDSSYINKTSFLENGFTSALGRALGYLNIGIDTSIASADEVSTAVNNQPEKKEDNRQWLVKDQLIATLKGTKEQALKVFKNYRMKKEYREKINNQFNLK